MMLLWWDAMDSLDMCIGSPLSKNPTTDCDLIVRAIIISEEKLLSFNI